MKKFFLPSILALLLPQFAWACGGPLYDPSSWLVIISGLLACIHGVVSFMLSGRMDTIKKGKILRRYTQGIFHFYISLPVVATLILVFVRVAYACIDIRSTQERYVDSLPEYAFFAWLASAVITIVCTQVVRAKSLSEERKMRIGKFSANLLFAISLCVAMFLSYALWVVAPGLSDKRNNIISQPLPVFNMPYLPQ